MNLPLFKLPLDRDLITARAGLNRLFRFMAVLCALTLSQTALAQSSETGLGETSFRYDGIGRLVGQIGPDPDGTSGPLHYPATRTVYDQSGMVVRVESGELTAWQPTSVNPASWPNFTILKTEKYFHDTMGRMVRSEVWGPGESAATSVVQTNYDHEGRAGCTAVRMDSTKFATAPASACTQTSITIGPDGWDRISKNVYDTDGRLRQVRKAFDNTTEIADVTYDYTNNGKLKTVIDANGNCAEMRYDGHDRLARWVFPSQNRRTYNAPAYTAATCPAGTLNENDFEAYAYDKVGNRTSLTKRDGTVISFQYDALNRLKYKNVDSANTRSDLAVIDERDVYYTYNLQGWQLSARFGPSASDPGIVNTYDGFGEPKTTTNSLISGNPVLAFTYDANGNRTQMVHPDGPAFDMTFDLLNRMKELKYGSSVLAAASYTSRGGVGAITHPGGSAFAENYGYDNLGRLTELELGATGPSHVEWSFQRNPASQIKTQYRDNDLYAWTGKIEGGSSYTTNGLNQYSAVGTVGFCYDANGNLTADGATAFHYDIENRLVEVRDRVSPSVCPTTTSGYTGDLVAQLHYDPAGRLYEAVQYDGAGTANTLTKDARFLYDGDAMVLEYSHSAASLDTIAGRYLHGNDVGADDPLIWIETEYLLSGLTHYLYADPRGSIVLAMNSDGVTHGINTYDEWGANDGTNVGRFQYTGQMWLPEAGLYYYKARIYSQRLGRFLQSDPIGYDDQINLYAYVANDPVNMRDANGTDGQSLWNGVVSWANDELSNFRTQINRLPSDAATLPMHIANGTTGLPPSLSGGGNLIAAPVGIMNALRLRVAAPTVELAESTLPEGVTRKIFAQVGIWQTEGGAAAAATRSREVGSEAIQALKDAQVSKGSVRIWQKFYQSAIETVRTDGTKFINQTAKYRSEVLKNVLKDW